MAKIGVEESLVNVQQALQERGYNVVPLRNENDVKNCDCCVISGQDQNVMGMQDVLTEAPVIDAQGKTADEVVQAVEERIDNLQ